jgi:hypothetical protein
MSDAGVGSESIEFLVNLTRGIIETPVKWRYLQFK